MLISVLFEHSTKSKLLLFVERWQLELPGWINLSLIAIEKLITMHIKIELIGLQKVGWPQSLPSWQRLLPHLLHLIKNDFFNPGSAANWANEQDQGLDWLLKDVLNSSVSGPQINRYGTCIQGRMLFLHI